MGILHEYSLYEYNTLHLECTAKDYWYLDSVEDLPSIHKYIKTTNSPYFIFGGGSNILLPNRYEGLIIHNNMQGIELIKEDAVHNYIRALAGTVWDDFVKYTLDHESYGLENLSAIPGTAGAAPIQNIGAYGVEAKDFIDYVECFDLNSGEFIQIANSACNFSYRNSRFKKEANLLVVAVVFKLLKSPRLNIGYGDVAKNLASISNPTAYDLRECITLIRKNKLPDPKTIANVGSFFHNPIIEKASLAAILAKFPELPVYEVDANRVKISAGWLIDKLGFKGYKYKNVGVYSNQALVLVNYSAISREEVLELAEVIRKAIFAEAGVWLNIEPVLV